MVNRCFLIALISLLAIPVFSQSNVIIGAATTFMRENPLNRQNYATNPARNSVAQYIWTKAEINGTAGADGINASPAWNNTGCIDRISFWKHGQESSTANCNNVEVWMKLDPASNLPFTTWSLAGYTLVYSGVYNHGSNTQTGWREIILDQPFYFDNVNNLHVLILNRSGAAVGTSGNSAQAPSWRFTNINSISSGDIRCRAYWDQTALPTLASATGNRANVRLRFNAAPAGSAPTSITGTSTICQGASTTLTAVGGGTNTRWYTGSCGGTLVGSGASINVSPASTTTYFAGNLIGCDGNTLSSCAQITVTVNSNPPIPTISAGGPTSFCPGGSVILTSSSASGNTWSTGSTNQSITVSSGGSYTVTVTNANNCSSTSASTSVVVHPVPPTPTISATQSSICSGGSTTLTSSSASGNTWNTGSTNQSIIVSSGGTYTVTATNANGCVSALGSITITEDTPPTINTEPVSNTTICIGTAGGVSVGASSGPYQWQYNNAGTWTNVSDGVPLDVEYVNSTTSNMFINVGDTPPGVYQYRVVLGNAGCTNVSSIVNVTVPGGERIAPLGPQCSGTTLNFQGIPSVGATYEWTVVPPGGTSATPLSGNGQTFSVTPTNNTGANILLPVDLEITVNGVTCLRQFSPTIHPLNEVPDLVVSTEPSCASPTGVITVNSPTGVGVEYSLDNITFQSGSSFAGLIPGNYTVYVRNMASTCPAVSDAVTIDNVPNSPATPVTSVSQPSCAVPTGEITVTAPAGAGIEYSIDGVNWVTSNSFTGLNPSTAYTVRVRDTNGDPSCVSTSVVNIDAVPSGPADPTLNVTQPTCILTSGSVSVVSPTGTDLAYSLDGVNWQSSEEFLSLAPSTYTLFVRDNASDPSCVSSESFTINAIPNLPTNPVASLSQPTCAVLTGEIQVTTPLGVDFEYSIDGVNWQTSPTFTNLNPTSYTLYVRDVSIDLTCVSSDVVVIQNPAGSPTSPTASIQHPDCNSLVGSITVTNPIGANFEYSIDGVNWQPNTLFDNLTANTTYTIRVRDVSGDVTCVSSDNFTIQSAPSVPVDPIVSVTENSSCDQQNGAITVTNPVGANYEYSIDGVNFQVSPVFNDLTTGTYNVTVTDVVSGCVSGNVTASVTSQLDEPSVPTIQISQQPTCADPTGVIEVVNPVGANYTYSINGGTSQNSPVFNGLQAGSYIVTVTNINSNCATPSQTVVINTDLDLPVLSVANVTSLSCNGAGDGAVTIDVAGGSAPYMFSWTPNVSATNSATDLAAGNYEVEVTDGNGCVVSINVVVDQPALITISPVVNNADCAIPNGSATVNVSGGVGQVELEWIDLQIQGSEISDLPPGTYVVQATDENGCTVQQGVSIGSNDNLNASIESVTNVVQEGSEVELEVVVSPDSGDYTYTWTPSNGLSCSDCPNPIASPAETTTYTVIVQSQDGCSDTSQVTIFVTYPCGELFIPSMFSPNADGQNDEFCVYGSCITDFEISIFDRWGELVFNSDDQTACWDGTFRGKLMNSAVFVYKLRATINATTEIEQSGNLNLIR